MVKNGTTRNRKQKYLCRGCRRQFIRDYAYQGCRPEVRRLIVLMTLNGSGIRDITRVREGTFEVTERAEQAVVNKEARVVEEVAINKEVNERTETIRDTLRKTEVDVQKVEGDEKRRGKSSGR